VATYSPVPDQVGHALQEIARVRQQLDGYGRGLPDNQELQERTDAAQAYAGESPQHFVSYVEEAVRTSSTAMRDVRFIQRQCWDLYQEKEPPNYPSKLEWQSQALLPKPYAAVQFAVAAVQAAFSPTFLSIKEEPSQKISDFWSRLMQRQLDEQHANFIIRFADATEMGFAVGQSFEMVPLWDSNKHCLTYSLVEPWKIDRDPDAMNREPQSGMYWIHSEWMDYWILREGEKNGQYQNTQGLQNMGGTATHVNTIMQQQPEQARLRQQIYQRNRFRHAVLVREFWGTVLAPNGELLLPNATYTTAGNRVIAPPQPSPYSTLRWPGVSFSPLPHLLRFDGRSLLQSVRSLWYLMCNMLSLHADYQNWIVNPMREVNQRGLIDQDDIDPYPGKVYLVRDTVSGQQVVRTVDQRFITNEILSNEGWYDQVFQRGTMVNDVVQGLPGYRQDITAREAAQNLSQSKTAFTKMGANLDVGAIQAILAGMETVRLHITRQDLLQIFTMDELLEYFGEGPDHGPALFVEPTEDMPNGVRLPELQGFLSVSGLQTLLQDVQEMQTLEKLIIPMAENPLFAPFLRPWNIAKAIEKRANLEDEHLFVNDDEAEKLMQSQQQQQGQQAEMQQHLMQEQLAGLQQQRELAQQQQALKAQMLQLQAQKTQLDFLVQSAQVQRGKEQEQAEVARIVAEIHQVGAEIAQTEQEIQAEALKIAGDLAKTEAQIQKIQAQIEAQDAKVQIQREQMRLQAAQRRNGEAA
jgi:hypothetical protein